MNYIISEEELKNFNFEQGLITDFLKSKTPVELITCIDTYNDNNYLILKELNEIGQSRKSQLCKIGKGYQRIYIQKEATNE